MLAKFGKGILAFVFLTIGYLVISTLVFLALYYFRQLYNLPGWLKYPEVIGISAMSAFAGIAAGGLVLGKFFSDYPERPVFVGFGVVMLALVGLIVVGQINFPADDILNGFIAPLTRSVVALGLAIGVAWNA